MVDLWSYWFIGDELLPDDGIKNGNWSSWLRENKLRTSGRHTFTSKRFYKNDFVLLKSGLIGTAKVVTALGK